MTWFKVDDGFHSHPKVLEAGNEAIGLYARCGSYCAQHLTEGLVPRAIALMYGDIALVDILVKVGLFKPVSTGWQMHDFLDYNPTKEKVLADREAAAKRQRDARERAKQARDKAAREGAAKNSHANSHGVTNAVSHADSHIGDYAHEGANSPNSHAVTHADAETAQDATLGPVLSLVQNDAGHDVAEEMSRRDSRQQSRLPRPDPTRPVLPTEVQEEQNPSSSVTATPPPDDTPATKPKHKAAKKPAAEPDPRPDVEALCNRLVELMAARGCRTTPVTDAWRTEGRLLLDKDGVHFQFAMDVLEWSQKSSFWKTNILSMPKFRKQWNTLYQQAEAACGPHPNNGRAPEPADAEVVAFGGNVVAIRPSIPAPRSSTTDRAVASGDTALAEFRRMTGRTA